MEDQLCFTIDGIPVKEYIENLIAANAGCCPDVLPDGVSNPNDDGTGAPLPDNGPLYNTDDDGNLTGVWNYDGTTWVLYPIAASTSSGDTSSSVDNGDGTTTITLADGSTVIVSYQCCPSDGGINTLPPAQNDPAPTDPTQNPLVGHDGEGNVLWTSYHFEGVGWVTCYCGGGTEPTVAEDDAYDGAVGEPFSESITTNDVPSDMVDNVVLDSGTLPAGLALNPDGTITGTPTESGVFSITYTLTSTSGSTDTATVTITIPSVAENPSIEITKVLTPDSSQNAPFAEGDTIFWSFVVTNTGDVPLTGVDITDDLTTVNGGPIDLAVGAFDDISFLAGGYTVTSADVLAGEIVNTATVTGTSPAGATATGQASATAPVGCPERVVCGLLGEQTSYPTTTVLTENATDSVFDMVYPSGATAKLTITPTVGTDVSVLNFNVATTGSGDFQRVQFTGTGVPNEYDYLFEYTEAAASGNGCANENIRMRSQVRDADEQTTVTTTDVTSTANVDAQSGDSYTAATGQAADMTITYDESNHVTGTTWAGTVTGIGVGDWVAFGFQETWRPWAEVTVDCNDAFVSAIDTSGNPVAEGDITYTP